MHEVRGFEFNCRPYSVGKDGEFEYGLDEIAEALGYPSRKSVRIRYQTRKDRFPADGVRSVVEIVNGKPRKNLLFTRKAMAALAFNGSTAVCEAYTRWFVEQAMAIFRSSGDPFGPHGLFFTPIESTTK